MVKVLTKQDKPQSFTIKATGILNPPITEIGVTKLVDPKDIREKDILRCKGLWDTGASNSVVSKSTAKSLGLKPITKVKVHHAGGNDWANVYLVNLFLPNRIIIPARVTECDDSDRFGIIIGMNIITLGDFAITNVNKKTTISFRMPSIETIDFVKSSKHIAPGANIKPPTVRAPMKNGKVNRRAQCPCGSGKRFGNCHGK